MLDVCQLVLEFGLVCHDSKPSDAVIVEVSMHSHFPSNKFDHDGLARRITDGEVTVTGQFLVDVDALKRDLGGVYSAVATKYPGTELVGANVRAARALVREDAMRQRLQVARQPRFI